MLKAEEVIGPLVIGEDYLVTCVNSEYGWVPVIPFPHRDPELSNPRMHLHYDYRFMQADLRDRIVGEEGTSVIPVTNCPKNPDYAYRRMACVSPDNRVDPCSFDRKGVIFIQGLEDACRDKRMVNAVCPHKGYSLAGIEPDSDGIVTCPLHGARWKPDGSYASRLIVGEALLAQYLKANPHPEPNIWLRLYSNEIQLTPAVTLDDLVEVKKYSQIPKKVAYKLHPRPRAVLNDPHVTFTVRGAASACGYYLTVAGWHKPIWIEAFRNKCIFRPLVMPHGGTIQLKMMVD